MAEIFITFRIEKHEVLVGEPVPLKGQVRTLGPGGIVPLPGWRVDIWYTSYGWPQVRRDIGSTYTDANGFFSYTWTPTANDVGSWIVHVGQEGVAVTNDYIVISAPPVAPPTPPIAPPIAPPTAPPTPPVAPPVIPEWVPAAIIVGLIGVGAFVAFASKALKKRS